MADPTGAEIAEAAITNTLIAGEDVTIDGDRTAMPGGRDQIAMHNHLLAREEAVAATAATAKTAGIFQANFNN